MAKMPTSPLTDAELKELFDALQEPRHRLLEAGRRFWPTSPEYRALAHVRIALDGAAELLTGRRDTFTKPEGPAPKGLGG